MVLPTVYRSAALLTEEAHRQQYRGYGRNQDEFLALRYMATIASGCSRSRCCWRGVCRAPVAGGADGSARPGVCSHARGRGHLDVSGAPTASPDLPRPDQHLQVKSGAAVTAIEVAGDVERSDGTLVFDPEWNWLKRPATNLQTFEYTPAYQAFVVPAGSRQDLAGAPDGDETPRTAGAFRYGSTGPCSAGSGSRFRPASSMR